MIESVREQPRVSVIIPTYNVEEYIGRAIESALNQSIADIEVIVVDDASTDGTLSIVKGFAERDPRVIAIACSENAGAAAARNLGFDAANGEWICPLDADDWFSPNRLSTLLESVPDSAVDMIADDFYFVDYESLEPQTTFSKKKWR
ncbi:MAG: glycosyltransferase family 2 protein [Synechococcus sp.]